MLREILARYGRLRAGYLWAFVTPLAQVAALYIVWIILWDRDDANLPILLFLVTGVLPFWLFRQSLREGATAAIRNQHLFKLPPVTIFDITFAHTLLELVTMLLVFSVAVFGTRLLGEAPRVQDPLGVLLGFVLMWSMGTGLGMTLAGLSKKLPSGLKFTQLLLGRPLFFTSGVFFTANMLPTSLREWLLYNPLLQATELIRSSFFYEFESTYYDLGYVGLFALALWTIGLATMRVNSEELSMK
ncbi:MAG: ABC transporter permease [Sedimenticolaceae bacterium]